MILPVLKKCSSGGDKLSKLPVEIIYEILLNLPAKDLQNLKHVSKFWDSLVSNSDFINIHKTQSPHSLQQLILFETVAIPTKRNPKFEYHQFGVDMISKLIDSHFPQTVKALSVKACCDGLVLFQDKYTLRQLYISNPVTGKFHLLPRISFNCSDWALVYDSRIRRYKVFAVNCQLIYTHLILGYGEGSLTWLWYGEGEEQKTLDDVLSNVFLIQKELHWLATEKDSENRCFFTVCSMHIEEYDKFKKTRAPLALPYDLDFVKHKGKHLLSEVNGSLCLTIVSHKQLKMFALEDRDKCLWTNCYTIRLQSHPLLSATFLSDDMCLFALGCVSRSDLVAAIKVLIHVEDKLFLYDLKTQEKTLVGFMSKARKLSRDYYFHSVSLIGWNAS